MNFSTMRPELIFGGLMGFSTMYQTLTAGPNEFFYHISGVDFRGSDGFFYHASGVDLCGLKDAGMTMQQNLKWKVWTGFSTMFSELIFGV